jgi:CDP-glucose 4,6-dehydratase
LAAQPLVRRGYRDPVRTFAVNVQALVELLEAIRTTPSVRAVVVVTTDKVYAEPVPSAGYVESDPLGAHDPYSSSKACAELVTDCYRRSFLAECGVLVASARAGNVIGGGDYSEDRLIPDCIRAVGSGHALKVRYPQATRPWQHVLEPLAGYLALGARLLAGVEPCARAWNFGPVGEPSWPVIAVLERCRARFPTLRIEPVGESQPREAAELRLDSSAAVEHLGWRPVWDTARAIERTLDWYAAALEHGECLSRAQLTRYLHEARERGVAWVA